MKMGQATLDDPAGIAAVDLSGMLSAVATLGDQLRRGFEIGQGAQVPPAWRRPSAIVVCGMGGSAIAGDVVRGLLGDVSAFPIIVAKGYALPAFCGPDTTVLAVSYSGNTEETLAAYADATERGCRAVSISAGGLLRELARRRDGVHVELPADAPMPRAALGYLAGGMLGMLGYFDLPDLAGEVEAAARYLLDLAAGWMPWQPTDRNEAKSLGAWLLGRIPVIWGSEGLMEPAALRLKNQLNENAKVPAFWSALPELDHNEVEGWSPETAKEFAVIALRHPGEQPRVAERFGLTLELASAAGLDAREVRAEGHGPLEWLFSQILLGDFVSTYLAILRGVDPTPVPALTGLKERLRR
ncbi:MAG: bifunctional phosphoglucose/phosphomannose isomerase [Actinobacteria bacterium]|nr:MAG: bifunctional phosphoglucose/phosphomannose isomerase [Actinomycetota bacterium]